MAVLGSRASAFRRLLQELDAEHEKEVSALHAENLRLKAALVQATQPHVLELDGAPPLRGGRPQSEDGSSKYITAVAADNVIELTVSEGGSAATRSVSGAVAVPEAAGSHLAGQPRASAPRKPSPLRQRLMKVCNSPNFEMVVSSLILANTLVMAVEVQYLGINAGYVLGYSDTEESWRGAGKVLEYLEQAFTVVFTAELLFRVAVLHCKFFRVPVNWLDVFVVASGLLDWVAQRTLSSNSVMSPAVLRLLRLLKLGRGLRLVRMSKALDSLHLLLKSIAASVSALFWSLCLLLVIQCIAGMIISQMVRNYIVDTDADLAGRRLVYGYYGTFTKSMITMFEVTFANWAPACRALVDNVGEGYAAIFLVYRCLIGFAVLNVIRAVFIQQTMKVAQQDAEIMIMQKQKASEDYSRKLRDLFLQLDASGDGYISREEFRQILVEPSLKAWMCALEIDSSDLESLFDLLDEGDGLISMDEFIIGASRIKGQAKSMDIAQLMASLRRVEQRLAALLLPGSDSQQLRSKRSTSGKRSLPPMGEQLERLDL